ncbi:MAG TPA: glycosyltransferase [Opitutales bacterium]|nr:glycosyltransferase [Opitutales bacterium]
MSPPLISVVLPVHNAARYVAVAVESILAQSFGDFELLLINDGSTDGSLDILQNYTSDARVRLITQEQSGLVKALNRGWREARGKYIARMDADDISLLHRFAQQVKFMEAHPEVAVLGGAAQCIDENGQKIEKVYRYPIEDAEIKAALRTNSVLVHPATMIRRDALAEVGGYRAAFVDAEDYDLWLRLGDRHRLANLPDVLINYRLHSGQVTVRKLFQQSLSCWGAQAAAECRQQTGRDPADTMKIIDIQALRELGWPMEKIETKLCQVAEGSIMGQTIVERKPNAQAIIKEAWNLLRRQGTRVGQAQLAWMVARWLRIQKCYGESLLWAVRACVAQPGYLWKGIGRAREKLSGRMKASPSQGIK